MRAVFALAFALAGCGRWGFAAPVDAGGPDDGDAEIDGDADATVGVPKPDAAPMIDSSVVMPDSAPGMGDYTVASATGTYTLLAGGTVFPGFTMLADDDSYTLALPFTFLFYGVAYTSINVSVNGYIAFDAPVSGADTALNDCPNDMTPPGAMIAVFWDDLYATDLAPLSNLTYKLGGVAPARTMTIEWRDFDAFYVAGGGNNSFGQNIRVTESIVLHETTNVIELRYGPRTAPTGYVPIDEGKTFVLTPS